MSVLLKSKTLKSGLGYTIGNILIKGINFLVLPIFSRLMTTEEFGIYNVFISYDAILFVIIGMALHSSVKSANIRFKDHIDEYISSVSLIYIFNTAILILLSIILGDVITGIIQFSLPVIILLVLYSFGTAVLTLYNYRISLEYSYKKYLIVAAINSFGNVSFSLLFILTVFNDDRSFGRILGSTITLVLIAVLLLISFYRKARPKFNHAYIKYGVKYSLPIIPHGISQVLLSQFDRIMIRHMINDSAVGIYSLAGNLKLILVIITDSISTVWSTWFYENISKEKNDVKQASGCLLLFFSILSVGMISISPELIMIIGGNNYVNSRFVAIPMVVDTFVIFIYNIIVPAEYYSEKTSYIMYGTLIASVLNIILNYIFINCFGYLAAAYTTLFSYVVYTSLHMFFVKKVLKFDTLPFKETAISAMMVAIVSVLDLLFINSIVLRYSICLFAISFIVYNLLKQRLIHEKIEKMRRK